MNPGDPGYRSRRHRFLETHEQCRKHSCESCEYYKYWANHTNAINASTEASCIGNLIFPPYFTRDICLHPEHPINIPLEDAVLEDL